MNENETGIKFETKGDDLFIDGKKVIKAWESFTGWYWFAVEKVEDRIPGQDGGGSIIDGQEVRDTIYFGLVQGQYTEWGYFSEAELNGLIRKKMAWRIPKKAWPYSGRRDDPAVDKSRN